MKHAADHPPFSADSTPLPAQAQTPDHAEAAAPQASWPQPVQTGPGQVSYRIRVNAPAQQLWELLPTPTGITRWTAPAP